MLHVIGRGGYGEVWLIRSLTGIYRAGKIIWRNRFSDAEPYEREFRAIQHYAGVSLQDPNLLKILHVGRNEVEGYFYYVMELADGAVTASSSPDQKFDPQTYEPRTLRADLDRQKHLPTAEVIRLGADLCRAVQSLHDHGLVHRDIKPSNIVFVSGVPKLADVGLVTAIREAATLVGTDGYVAPEGPGKPAADVYAAGKVLYEMTTGLSAREFPRLPNRSVPDAELPKWRELNEILLRACDPRTEDRYPTAQALLNDLLLVEAGTSIRGWLILRRQAKWLKLAAVVLVGVAGAAIVVALYQRKLNRIARHQAEKTAYSIARLEMANGKYGTARKALENVLKGSIEKAPLPWRILYNEAFGAAYRELPGGQSEVTRIAVSATGDSIAAHFRDLRVLEWKGSNSMPKEFENFSHLGGYLPNGERLLVLGDSKLTSSSPHLLVHTETNSNLSFAVGGSYFCIRSQVHTDPRSPIRFQVFNAENLTAPKQLEVEQGNGNPMRLALSQDGTTVVFERNSGNGEQIEAWSVGSRLQTGVWQSPASVLGISLSPDMNFIGLWFGSVAPPYVINTKNGTGISLRDCRQATSANSIAFEPGGYRVATGGIDGVIRIWSTTTGELLDTLHGHVSHVSALTWTPDGATLLSGDGSGLVRAWRMHGGTTNPNRLNGFNDGWGTILLGSRSQKWSANLVSNSVAVWRHHEEQRPMLNLPGEYQPVLFEKNDELLWTINQTHSLRKWDIASGNNLETIRLNSTRQGTTLSQAIVDSVRNRAYLLYWIDARPIYCLIDIWDLNHPERPMISLDSFGRTYSLQLSPNGNHLVVANRSGGVLCWRTDDFQIHWRLPDLAGESAANGPAFSPDGKSLATGTSDGRIRIIDSETGRIRTTLKNSAGQIMALAYSQSGSHLVASFESGLLEWFFVTTGEHGLDLRLESFSGNRKTPRALWRLAFSLDDAVLVGLTNGSSDENGSDSSCELVRWKATNAR